MISWFLYHVFTLEVTHQN